MKSIEDVMVRDVVTVEPSISLVEAANRMREANVGMLPIVDEGRLRAILTDRDVVVRAVARNADPTTTRAIECATEDPVSAQPDWDTDDALELMGRAQVGRLPVVDDEGRLVGVVTLSSLLLHGEAEDEVVETAKRVSQRAAKRPAPPAAAERRRGKAGRAKSKATAKRRAA